MTEGDGHCLRPCTDVDYSVGKDMFGFGLSNPEEVAEVGGCAGEGVISIKFGRRFLYETVTLALFMPIY